MIRSTALAAAIVFMSPATAFAYLGPGLGLGAVGTVIGILAAVVLLTVGLVWYPVKRMLKKMSKSVKSAEDKLDAD